MFRELLFAAGALVLGFVAAAIWFADRTPTVDDGARLYQESAIIDGEWHHVATVHGWADDLEVCRELAEYLERTGASRYSCRPVAINN